ncbi:KAP family P-loop NTPase fold protein [Castellaniella sp.]|uniref:KAP family P-loop NTPase fold protein n=1 Tax=Castellaniella sp. TaxID=1955812 RepID=UPI002AFF8D2A|nr:P-loop NTPase fold protein [Castellaniella sp.]
MRILPPPLEIGDEEGFSPRKDIFKRKKFGDGLTNLVQNVEDPLVVLLDSPWGSGKTTFLKMWAGELRKAGHPVIYFDAFAHDHIGNAFLAIAGEVIGLAQKRRIDQRPKAIQFLNTAAKTGGVIIRGLAKAGVKAATLGALDAADLKEAVSGVADDLAGVASDGVDEYVKGLLERQSKENQTLEEFRKALGELAAELAKPAAGESPEEGEEVPALKAQDRPLIFILDELDRCKPTFALDLLETIKHLFSVPNVHFVLSANHAQLRASVQFSYGTGVDATLYLQKFYNFSVSLPDLDGEWGHSIAEKYLKYLIPHLVGGGSGNTRVETVIDVIKNIAIARDMSLRSLERASTIATFSLAMTNSSNIIIYIIAGLSVMKGFDPEIYDKAKDGSLSWGDVNSVFRFDRWPKRAEALAHECEHCWKFALGEHMPDSELQVWQSRNQSIRSNSNLENPRQWIPVMARSVVDRLQTET